MIEIRRFKQGEVEKFVSIRRCALETSPDEFAETLASFDAVAFVRKKVRYQNLMMNTSDFAMGAFAEDIAVGMCLFSRLSRDDSRHRGLITSLFVRPEYRGQGLGEKLLRSVFDEASKHYWLKEIVLSVKSANERAISLYKRLGMEDFDPPFKAELQEACCNETHLRWIK